MHHPRNDILPPPPADLLEGAALFLDFDGTLVELAERPDAVAVSAELRDTLRRLLARLEGRVAIISGRPAAQIRELFGPVDFAISGSHGVELVHADGRVVMAERPAALDEILAEADAFAAANPGVLIENKPLGVAIHYRQAPEVEQEAIALAMRLAAAHQVALQPGKMMAELRVGGGDKGSALRALMEEPNMAGARPVFLGDDVTDEPGLAAAAALGGAGVLVGPARETAARYRLDGVADVLAWLAAAAVRGEGAAAAAGDEAA
ncbi:trehalose-phosphatase [Sphingomonas aracearum]|uniref:Trehalose 6-phosphate phosphatase n=1 Tax=Sphingomonas aracearum TaxID=2283317 RepID=A0A369VR76_9SPHN|nr:trehalose-phosphatase [Sphingomonas aracearum]RDE04886.1 trehalose-phosphatase [Sphingomonas aracearum]